MQLEFLSLKVPYKMIYYKELFSFTIVCDLFTMLNIVIKYCYVLKLKFVPIMILDFILFAVNLSLNFTWFHP